MKKIFFDTEFTGLHQNTTIISIGLISDCGKTFYAEFADYDRDQVDDWLRENVITNLYLQKFDVLRDYQPDSENVLMCGDTEQVSRTLKQWLHQFITDSETKIEMWSDCLSYDWVLFQSLFGNAFDVPEWIYYIPFDICTLFKMKGIDPDISREKFALGDNYSVISKHNALWDAKIIKLCYYNLKEYGDNCKF